jgi:Golgi phosphoprotein 3
MLNLTEELFLIALHQEKGQIPNSISISFRFCLGGALLADLLLAGRVRLEEKDRLALVSAEPTGDDLLDEALVTMSVAQHSRKIFHWVNVFSSRPKKFQERLTDRLVEKGILQKEEKMLLWVIPYAEYPQQDASAKYWIKKRLRAVVLAGEKPSQREAALLSLLCAADLLDHVFTRDELKQARKKVNSLVQDEVIGRGVGEALQALEAATLAAARAERED